MFRGRAQQSMPADHTRYLQLLDIVHLLRATAGPVELELLLPEDLLTGYDVLYGLPVRRVPGIEPGVVARLPERRDIDSEIRIAG